MKNILLLFALSFLIFSCDSTTDGNSGRDENGDFPKSETVYEQPTNPGYTETEYGPDPNNPSNRRPILQSNTKPKPKKQEVSPQPNVETTTKDVLVYETVDTQPFVLICDGRGKALGRKRKCNERFLFTFIEDNLVQPTDSVKAGRVLVRFTVNVDGTISNESVIQSLSPSQDKSALEVITKLKNDSVKWSPAVLNGEPVPSYFVLPIEFKI
jgi:TonB family protein